MSKFKPMLSGAVSDPATEIQFPCWVSGKLDGIRVLIRDGVAVTRSLKPVGNVYTREWLQRILPEGADGELLGTELAFNDTSGAVRRSTGEPNLTFFWFDWVREGETFLQRQEAMREYGREHFKSLLGGDRVVFWPSTYCPDMESFLKSEQQFLDANLEGIMIRQDSPYKFGRSTVREGALLKFKRFDDGEGEVIGLRAKMQNNNEATINELGHTERSGHQENKTPLNMLGAFIVRDLATGQEFRCGTGFDHAFATEVWANQEAWMGKIIKYKWQKSGQKDKPRFPVFMGERLAEDMST